MSRDPFTTPFVLILHYFV